jgi:hypothetical protein
VGEADIDGFVMEDAQQVAVEFQSAARLIESLFFTNRVDPNIIGELHSTEAHGNHMDGVDPGRHFSNPRGRKGKNRVV